MHYLLRNLEIYLINCFVEARLLYISSIQAGLMFYCFKASVVLCQCWPPVIQLCCGPTSPPYMTRTELVHG